MVNSDPLDMADTKISSALSLDLRVGHGRHGGGLKGFIRVTRHHLV